MKTLIDEIKLKGGKIYLVGGPVRDQLMSIEKSKDADYVICGIPLADLKNVLQKYGSINLVGQAFGVIKFRLFDSDSTVDISLPRKELSTGAGHKDFAVDFDHNLNIEKDLGRRDFTINAMARELPDGGLIDPFNGKADLENRILRMVFESSFTDDPLRILRGVQFAARFGLAVENKTFDAVKKYAHLIETVSPERIAEELNKLLEKAAKPSTGFMLMKDTGLLKHVLPELQTTVGVDQPGGYHRWDVFEHTLHVIDEAPPDLAIRLAALFHDTGKPQTKNLVENGATFYGHDKLSRQIAEKALKRLRYSNDIIKKVCLLVERHMFSENAGDKGIRRLINRVGVDSIFDLIALRKADTIAQGMGQDTSSIDEFRQKVEAEIEKKSAFGIKDLEIDGNILMAEFKLKESPLIGEVLNYLLDKVLDEPELNIRERLVQLSGEYLRQKNL